MRLIVRENDLPTEREREREREREGREKGESKLQVYNLAVLLGRKLREMF